MKYEVWAPRYHQVFATLEEASRHIPPVGPAWIVYGSRRVMDYMDSQAVKGYVYEQTPKYIIKCDDCKKTIGETDSLAESAAGGQCASC